VFASAETMPNPLMWVGMVLVAGGASLSSGRTLRLAQARIAESCNARSGVVLWASRLLQCRRRWPPRSSLPDRYKLPTVTVTAEGTGDPQTLPLSVTTVARYAGVGWRGSRRRCRDTRRTCISISPRGSSAIPAEALIESANPGVVTYIDGASTPRKFVDIELVDVEQVNCGPQSALRA
jgi:hypothetical protein